MKDYRTEQRLGMDVDWDVPIEMDDGVVLRADVYRPPGGLRHPVILAYGPYAKWLHYADGSPYQWKRMSEDHPDTVAGSTNTFQSWEVVDPEKWVPDGYVCVRIDSRGAGRSPGYLDPWSPRETRDLYECIEWAGTREWSDGKVGVNGISYYAMNQWQVGGLRPPHLAALCIWEGAADLYRDMAYHGGILSTFPDIWFEGRVVPKQHGLGHRGHKSRFTGEYVSGPPTLTDEELGSNRTAYGRDLLNHPHIDDYWEARAPDLANIDVPLLSAGNWGGMAMHLRGNVEGFVQAGTQQKWLELHGLEHWTHFYTDYGVALQKRFFGHFLKGEDTGWDRQPRVLLQIRHPGHRFEERYEDEWPLGRTRWTRFYLDPAGASLSTEKPTESQTFTYQALGAGLTFLSAPLEEPMEITGPAAAKLFVSSDTQDADIFVVLRVFTPDMAEVTFVGANEPHTPISHGWLRASHRKLDPDRTLPYRPYHTHDELQPLTPGEVYELDVEIWPTCIVVPTGYRIGVSLRGRDYVYPGSPPAPLPAAGIGATSAAVFTGVGPFRHNQAADRNPATYGGNVTLHAGGEHPSFMLLPIVPEQQPNSSHPAPE